MLVCSASPRGRLGAEALIRRSDAIADRDSNPKIVYQDRQRLSVSSRADFRNVSCSPTSPSKPMSSCSNSCYYYSPRLRTRLLHQTTLKDCSTQSDSSPPTYKQLARNGQRPTSPSNVHSSFTHHSRAYSSFEWLLAKSQTLLPRRLLHFTEQRGCRSRLILLIHTR